MSILKWFFLCVFLRPGLTYLNKIEGVVVTGVIQTEKRLIKSKAQVRALQLVFCLKAS